MPSALKITYAPNSRARNRQSTGYVRRNGGRPPRGKYFYDQMRQAHSDLEGRVTRVPNSSAPSVNSVLNKATP